MGFLDNAKKKAAEAAELLRQKAAEAAELAKEKAEEGAEQARIKAEELKLSEFCSNLTDKTSKICKNMADSMVGAKDSTFGWIHGKISDAVRGMNLQETITAIEKAGREQKVNVAPLVKFVERIKKIGDDDEQ